MASHLGTASGTPYLHGFSSPDAASNPSRARRRIMSFYSWLRGLRASLERHTDESRRGGSPRRPLGRRLALEALEDRAVPAALGYSSYFGTYAQINAVAVDAAGDAF